MQTKEYALYKGEELIAMGTKREIAEQLGVSASTIGYYGTPLATRWKKSLDIRFGLKGLTDAVNTSIEIQKLKCGFLHRKQNLKDFEHTTPAKSLKRTGSGGCSTAQAWK